MEFVSLGFSRLGLIQVADAPAESLMGVPETKRANVVLGFFFNVTSIPNLISTSFSHMVLRPTVKDAEATGVRFYN
jgi:hypothetical protein